MTAVHIRERKSVGQAAFTLIEIMVVVAIMGLILAAGVPSLSRVLQKEGFRKTMSDIKDACHATRRAAVMEPTKRAQLVFRPGDGTFSGGGKGGKIEGAVIDGLFVNLRNFTREDQAVVNFYPNGTSDEFLLILRSERNEQLALVIELATGTPAILSEQELQKLRDGAL